MGELCCVFGALDHRRRVTSLCMLHNVWFNVHYPVLGCYLFPLFPLLSRRRTVVVNCIALTELSAAELSNFSAVLLFALSRL